MATGYTDKIVNGKMRNFNDFAKLCVRAFGATIHMKEDSLDMAYVTRTPSFTYNDDIKRLKSRITNLKKLSDTQITNKRFKDLKSDIKYHENEIKRQLKIKSRLEAILQKANEWNPPTTEHVEYKNFMIQQLTDTIKWDVRIDYHQKAIATAKRQARKINPKALRNRYIKEANEEIVRYTKHDKDEIKRCESANKWISDVFATLQ